MNEDGMGFIARIAELEAENERLKAELDTIRKEVAEECADICEDIQCTYKLNQRGYHDFATAAREIRQKFNITD